VTVWVAARHGRVALGYPWFVAAVLLFPFYLLLRPHPFFPPEPLDIGAELAKLIFTTTRAVKQQIMEQVDHLAARQRRQVPAFARRLAARRCGRSAGILRFAGCIAPADLAAMSQAIQDGCEKVDANAW
jgi:hypothetical protein